MTASDFDQVIEDSHEALAEFVKGNPGPLKGMYSHKTTLASRIPLVLPYVAGRKRRRRWSVPPRTTETAKPPDSRA